MFKSICYLICVRTKCQAPGPETTVEPRHSPRWPQRRCVAYGKGAAGALGALGALPPRRKVQARYDLSDTQFVQKVTTNRSFHTLSLLFPFPFPVLFLCFAFSFALPLPFRAFSFPFTFLLFFLPFFPFPFLFPFLPLFISISVHFLFYKPWLVIGHLPKDYFFPRNIAKTMSFDNWSSTGTYWEPPHNFNYSFTCLITV